MVKNIKLISPVSKDGSRNFKIKYKKKSKFTSYNLHINILNVVCMHVAIVLYFPEIFGEKGVKTKWMEH